MSSSQLETSLNRELESIVGRLVQHFHPLKILLFGSFADGSFDECSDIDLLMVLDTKTRFGDRIEAALAVIDSTRPVQILVYTPEELSSMLERGNDFIATALEQARVLYEKPAN